jgi:hypothetical protein
MNEQAQAFVKAMNGYINIMIRERDRVTQLMSETLPRDTTVWSLLPSEVRDEIKRNMKENLTYVQSGMPEVLKLFDAVPTSTVVTSEERLV